MYYQFSKRDCSLVNVGLERQIADDIQRKAEEERLAAKAAAAAAAEARATVSAASVEAEEGKDTFTAESPAKCVTLVEGPSSGWKTGPTASILKRSVSQANASKQASRRAGKK